MEAKTVSSLDECLYYYIRRIGSITKSNSPEKNKTNVYDILYHFDNIYSHTQNSNVEANNKKIILSYLANTVISKAKILQRKDRKEYVRALKKRNVSNLLLEDNIKHKAKKILIKTLEKFS